MSSSSIDDAGYPGKSVRAWPWFGRKHWVIILVTVGLVATGAFLFWGPIGIGNGPLSVVVGGTEGWADSGQGPVGLVIPIRNSGKAPAVIDRIDLIGGTSYPAPHVVAMEVLTSGLCGGAWPARQGVRGFELAGCGGTDAGPLVGHAFDGPTPAVFFGFPAVAEVTAPRPGTCWVLTKIVVHYRVGNRNYSAGGPYQLAVCADSDQVNSAMNAAEGAGLARRTECHASRPAGPGDDDGSPRTGRHASPFGGLLLCCRIT